MNRLSIISVTVALIAGMVGCVPVQYELTISSTEGGSVITPGEGTGSFTYDEAEVVNLGAESDEGYRFESWSGDASTIADANDATTTITMNSDYSITANFEEEEAVTFPYHKLDAAVRGAIGKPTGDIYPSDLDELASLDASERNIADLAGLEQCTSLTGLELYDNQIDDISPLADLTALSFLSLGANQINDISPLAGLTHLTYLGLGSNQISNVSPLANLNDLYWLTLDSNQISDISPLANLTNLGRLELRDNQISDISSLTNLTDLFRLGLSSNQIHDISPLANLTSVISLDIGNNQVSDILPLGDNSGLGAGDQINLQSNPLSSESINTYIPQLEAKGVTVEY